MEGIKATTSITLDFDLVSETRRRGERLSSLCNRLLRTYFNTNPQDPEKKITIESIEKGKIELAKIDYQRELLLNELEKRRKELEEREKEKWSSLKSLGFKDEQIDEFKRKGFTPEDIKVDRAIRTPEAM